MPTFCLCALAAVLAWTPLTTRGQERPRALENAQRQRDLLQTGTVEFYHQFTSETRPPSLYTARFGGENDAATLRGDEGGVFHNRDGTVVPDWRPHALLMRKQDTWTYDSDGLEAELSLDPAHAEHVWKLRSLGLNSFNSYRDVHDTLWSDGGKQPGARSYSETLEDGLHVVRARTERGLITWYIDSQRGWNPVRVTYERNGQEGLVAESRSTLQQYDGVWFPATVAFFGADPDHPVEVVTVTSAAFNRPDQPRVLGPADIGIEAGMSIRDGVPGHELMRFDGEKAVSEQEFRKRLFAGEIKYGPTFLRTVAEYEAAAAERDDAPHDARTDAPDARSEREAAWEKYTRDFIARYHLDDGQTQKALSILRECQEEADQYLLRHKSDFDQLRNRTKKLAQANSPDSDELSAITAQRLKLRQPIGEIFERQLQPRLEKLPTRAQRASAERDEPPATRPAQAP